MRCALLVARREFAEIAKTRGFWIGMLGLPVLVLLSMQGLLWLERKATPVRYFVLLDRSGGLGPAVRTALDRYRATRKSGPLRPVPQRRLLNLRVFFITIKITDERHPRTPEPQKHLRADHSVHRFVCFPVYTHIGSSPLLAKRFIRRNLPGASCLAGAVHVAQLI
jgi:hypothetical protein